MSEILIQSKITTPQLHEKIVHRERLTSLLDDNKNKNLIIVCAPAGFGKTTLVLDYLASHNNNHTWFSVPHRGIEDASTFFEYLIGAVKNLKNEFGPGTLEVMKQFASSPQMAKELVYACTASFVNEFQKCFSDDVVLVIEDLHYVGSEKAQKWLKEFFKELLDNIPPNLHLILSTRVMPELTLTRLKAQRNAFIIGENDLSFSEEETGALLNEVYRYKYDENDIKLLDENVKGWVTGLHLLLQAYGEDFAKVKYKSELDKEIIFDFFAHEIFDNLSAELQEFMMVTSLMESFDEELANAVLGIENSRQLTEELIHKNLFIHQVHSIVGDEFKKKISYGYHALFKDFLKRKLESSKLTQEIKKLMEKIGDSYLSSEDEITAVDYFLEAWNFEKAIKLIIKDFEPIFDSGKYDILWGWFNLLPENIICKHAVLLHYLSWILLYTNTDRQKCLNYINKSIELFILENNENKLLDSTFMKTIILLSSGKIDQIVRELESLLKRCNDPHNIFKIYNRLSFTYSSFGKFEEAAATLKKAMQYCDENKFDKKVIDQLDEAFATLYYYTGENEKALLHFNKMLKNDTILYDIIIHNCNMAVVHIQMNDFQNSIKHFNIAFRLMENSYSRDLLVKVTSQNAELLQVIGDFEESTRILENIYHEAENNNCLIDLYNYTEYLFLNYYNLNNRNKCLKYLNLNRSFTEALGEEHYMKMFQVNEALFLMNFELHPSLEEKLIDCYNYFSGNPAQKKRILFLLSNFYLIINKPQMALRHLHILFNQSTLEANSLISFRNLIDFSLSRPELAQFKDKVHCAFTEFFDRLNIEGTTDDYKRKMRIEIEKLYDIKMTSFGALEFETRGNKIPEKSWRRKKGKSILAYMMLNPKGKYNKDKIIDMFFPEAKPETAEDSFKQTVFSIRSVFKNPCLEFLKMEGNTLYLNPDCYFKSDAEEFDKLRSAARSPERNKQERVQACKDAIGLYKGEFIEGNYEPWCEDLRSEYLNKFISVSELLLDLLCKEKKFEDVVYYSENLLKHDRLNEKAYLSLVEAFVKTEKLKSARDTYSNMLKTYEEELAENPDPKIQGIIKQLIET